MVDYNLWLNDINHRFTGTISHTAIGDGFKATAVISSVTTNSAFKASLWDAYFDLRSKLLGLSDEDSHQTLPESTTTQATALTNIADGTPIYNITTSSFQVSMSDTFANVGGGSSSNTDTIGWASKDPSGIQAAKTHQVQPWSSTTGLNESTTTSIGDQIFMTKSGTIKNLYAAVATAAGNTKTHIFTIRNNGVDTSLASTLSNATSGNDTTNSFTFAAGDLISLKVVGSTGCTSSGQFTASVEIIYD